MIYTIGHGNRSIEEFIGLLDATGFEPIGSTPGEFGTYIRTEVAKWAKVVNASGAKAD